jgi:hypothetical protein
MNPMPVSRKTGRNYSFEYNNYDTPERKKKRAMRNKARRMLTRAGLVKKGDGKDVDHRDMNAKNNKRANLRAIPASTNRRRQPKVKGPYKKHK